MHTAFAQEDQPTLIRLAQATPVQQTAPLATKAPPKVQLTPFDIYISGVKVGHQDYLRPVVMIRQEGESAVVAPISTKWSFFDPTRRFDFQIKMDSPEFGATGLVADSFVIGETARIPVSSIRKRIGTLSGNLRSGYLEQSGQ